MKTALPTQLKYNFIPLVFYVLISPTFFFLFFSCTTDEIWPTCPSCSSPTMSPTSDSLNGDRFALIAVPWITIVWIGKYNEAETSSVKDSPAFRGDPLVFRIVMCTSITVSTMDCGIFAGRDGAQLTMTTQAHLVSCCCQLLCGASRRQNTKQSSGEDKPINRLVMSVVTRCRDKPTNSLLTTNVLTRCP